MMLQSWLPRLSPKLLWWELSVPGAVCSTVADNVCMNLFYQLWLLLTMYFSRNGVAHGFSSWCGFSLQLLCSEALGWETAGYLNDSSSITQAESKSFRAQSQAFITCCHTSHRPVSSEICISSNGKEPTSSQVIHLDMNQSLPYHRSYTSTPLESLMDASWSHGNHVTIKRSWSHEVLP